MGWKGWICYLARVFTLLYLAVAALDEHNNQVWGIRISQFTPPEPHPRLSPYPTRFDDHRTTVNAGIKYIKLESIDAFRADPTNIVFLTKIRLSGQGLAIKFFNQ